VPLLLSSFSEAKRGEVRVSERPVTNAMKPRAIPASDFAPDVRIILLKGPIAFDT